MTNASSDAEFDVVVPVALPDGAVVLFD